jgi:hypothetical protein
MVLKKVLLGFATTTSFILLVMIAPTTTATTTTASLQQQDNDNATTTIDEPNIPIEPPAEDEEEPDEPIPDNENNDTGGIDEPPILREPIPPLENETGDGVSGEGNVTTQTTKCPDVPKTKFGTDKKTYKQGEDVIVSASLLRPPRDAYSVTPTHNTPLEVRWVNPDDEISQRSSLQPKYISYGGCDYLRFQDSLENVQEVGTWVVIATYKSYYEPLDIDLSTRFAVVTGGSPPPKGLPDTWINSVRTPDGKNIANGGTTTSRVVTVDFQSTATDTGKGSRVDLTIDNDDLEAVASPKTIRELSVGKHTIELRGVDKYGNKDPTPAKWTFTVVKGNPAGYPDT